MTSQRLWSLPFTLTWILVYFLLPVCSGVNVPKLHFTHTVFVAFDGEGLTVNYTLQQPANQSQDFLRCFDPSGKQIYEHPIPGNGGTPHTLKDKVVLERLDSSGEYTCMYTTAKAYLFLRLRAHGFSDVSVVDMQDFIIVIIFTGGLLIFSVLSTVYLFRGHWKPAQCCDQNKDGMQDKEKTNEKESSVDGTASSSFYASLEHRPRSIYDVLDHTAANVDVNKRETTPMPKPSRKTTPPQTEDEGVFDSVYENL